MATDEFSLKILDLDKYLKDLRSMDISDPGKAAKILSETMVDLQSKMKDLSSAKEPGRRKEGLNALSLSGSIIKDFTEEVQANRTLCESEERYREIIETTDEGIATHEPDGTIIYVNQHMADMLGYSREEIIGRSSLDFVYDEEREAVTQARESLKEQGSFSKERKIRRKDGSILWTLANVTPRRDEAGNFLGYMAMHTDITERKQYEEALRWNKERVEILSEVISRLLASDRPQEIVEDLCRKVMNFLDCHAFFNYLVDENKGCIHLNAYAGIPDETAENIEWLGYGVAVCGCAARDGVRIVAENIPETSDPRTELVKSFGIKAYACHPLISERSVIGTLSFGTRSRTKFSDDDLAMMRDVADQVSIAMSRFRDEEALKESEEKFRALSNASTNAILVYRDNRLLYVNPATVSISGYTEEELLKMDFIDLVHPDYRDLLKEGVKKRMEGYGELAHYEAKIIKKTGEETWLDISTNLIHYEGSPAGIVTCMDITDRKQAEEVLKKSHDKLETRVEERTVELRKANLALSKSEERFRVALKNSPIVVFNQDKDLRYTWIYNPTPGLTVDTTLGKTDKELLPPKYASELTKIKRRVLESGIGERVEARTIVNGEEFFYDLTVEPLRNTAEDIEGITCASTDITERKMAENELVKAKEAAVAAAKAKEAFMANMSHELRTPMNYIVGMTSLLLEEPLTPELKDFVETIRKGSDEMMSLINDILDFAKVEKENMVLEYQPLSLRLLVDESIEMVAPQAAKKCLTLASNFNYGIPENIIGDHGRLRQILVSLLSNAIKFTDEGEVSLSISSKSLQKTNKHQILFAIRDTGIGIPPDKMSELFQPFAQVETELSRKRDGVGLGLAANKKLVELMGGEIWAKSEVGKGSTFYFTIDAEIAPDADVKPEPDEMTQAFSGVIPEVLAEQYPLRILIAEDIPSNQKVLLEMLKRMGYKADAVADGKEILQALEMRPYDLILMDIKMPGMDGIAAAREICRRYPDNGPKIVAIIAYPLAGDKEKCVEAGMDGYISKPVKKDDLANVLKRYQQSKNI